MHNEVINQDTHGRHFLFILLKGLFWFIFLGSIENTRTLLGNALVLTHWGRVTHIYVGNLTIIDSDNGLSPAPR